MVMTNTGRTFAARPRSASQTSPRLGFITPFCPIEHLERFRDGRNLVRVCPNPIRVVEYYARFPGSVELPQRLLYLAQLIVIEPGQGSLNFSNGAHNYNIAR